MRIVLSIAVLGLLTLPAQTQTLPDWAYPVNPTLTPLDDKVQKHLTDSTKAYTQAQIDDGFNPSDWYPQDHPPMPDVVAHGRKAANARACAMCHLTSGGGQPESARLAGLPVGYVMRQMAEFKSGARHGAGAVAMVPIARGLSEEDLKAAAEYFTSLTIPTWYKVVETATVPKSYLANGAMRLPVEHGGTEPIGNRIIELPQDIESAESRNPRVGFVAHVPPGSIKKGEAIVTTGADGKTLPCATCHGPNLTGVGDVPPIIGRSPMYIYRQLNDIKIGTRNGAMAPLMKGVVEKLTDDDMIAIAAYLVSKGP
ncbi:MAG TPA: c-type cytochrome [Xanthobacteraceae bacterium]|nr:c-type cytochrome [Xanthobacteraceae bacterium]